MSFVRRTFLPSVLAMALAACAGAPAATDPVPTTRAMTTTVQSSAAPPATATATPSAGPTLNAAGLPVFAPDEPLVLYGHLTGAGGGIFVMHPDGSGKIQLALDVLPGVHMRANWSPDGQDVVFVEETTGRLWIAHLDGRPTSLVATCLNNGCDFPVWSPDGMKIAYSRVESEDGVVGPASVGIEVIDLATGAVTEVVRFSRPTLADFPSWSPDGSQIAFQVDQMDAEAFETGAALAIVPAAGGKVRYLTSFDVFVSGPDWGWTTDEIVFSTDLMGLQRELPPNQGTWDVWAIRPDGSGLRRLTHLAAGGQLKAPKWAPDGSVILAYNLVANEGVTVNPATGALTPFPTGQYGTRPNPRPLPAP